MNKGKQQWSNARNRNGTLNLTKMTTGVLTELSAIHYLSVLVSKITISKNEQNKIEK